MKKKMLFVLALILFVGYVYAVKVSPVRYDLSIPRGSSKELVLSLSGIKGLKSQNLLIYPSDLFMSRSGALTFDTIKDSKNSAVKWIKMEKIKLTIFEGQEKKVKFKISIPSSAVSGEYYAVIMVEPEIFTDAKDTKRHVNIQMKSRVAVVVVLDVPGRTYQKKAEATELKVIETDSLAQIISTFENSGDIHLDVVGDVIIRSADGKINFGKFDLKAFSSAKKEAFVFPGAMRDFGGFVGRQLPRGDYVAEASYNYGYEFKKAKITQKFSIKRATSLNEAEVEFLSVESKKLQLTIPAKAMRTQIIKITNTDYRAVNVSVESDDWIKINPKSFSLKPGEVRNIQVIISVSEFKEPVIKAGIVLKTDRGKATKIALEIYKPGTPIPVEKVEKEADKKVQASEKSEPAKEADVEKKADDQPTVVEEPKPAEEAVVEKKAEEPIVLKNINFMYAGFGFAGLIIIILLAILIKVIKGKKSTKI